MRAAVQERAHDPVEWHVVAKGALDHGEHARPVSRHGASRLAEPKLGEAAPQRPRGALALARLTNAGVAAAGPRGARAREEEHLDRVELAAHREEAEDLHHTPQPAAVGRAVEDEQRAASGEEDWQPEEACCDVVILPNAAAVQPQQRRPPVRRLERVGPAAQHLVLFSPVVGPGVREECVHLAQRRRHRVVLLPSRLELTVPLRRQVAGREARPRHAAEGGDRVAAPALDHRRRGAAPDQRGDGGEGARRLGLPVPPEPKRAVYASAHALGEEEREDQSADAVAVGGEGEVGRDWPPDGEKHEILRAPRGGAEGVARAQHHPLPAQRVAGRAGERRGEEADRRAERGEEDAEELQREQHRLERRPARRGGGGPVALDAVEDIDDELRGRGGEVRWRACGVRRESGLGPRGRSYACGAAARSTGSWRSRMRRRAARQCGPAAGTRGGRAQGRARRGCHRAAAGCARGRKSLPRSRPSPKRLSAVPTPQSRTPTPLPSCQR
mmetsp:Transcript_24095/g.69281  ORF Transcript_24095/g.69281 Transcript_24095/m.69281 type:complete len:500 (+) Transcript_24095:257-1756(+)